MTEHCNCSVVIFSEHISFHSVGDGVCHATLHMSEIQLLRQSHQNKMTFLLWKDCWLYQYVMQN
jgi:hypothetical protein